ncbi:HAD family hydrolase [Microbispora sp. H13382]|uniref:HAD family hydrolase n=1 Tax=Microbispora sp. H13382 TaxID=2729112 RepID=UPI0016034061|nr:HAD family hydrolase [Microbispora sp. H13382]
MIRAILFDLDETLFDHRRAVAHAATRWTESVCPGHELLPETPALWLDLEDKHLPAWHAGECSFAEQRRRRLREFCRRLGLPQPADPDAAFAGFLTHYESAWAAFPDVNRTLKALAALDDAPALGVLTNGLPVQQEAKLRRIGLLDRMDVVLTPDALGAFKPSVECYRRAAAKLGLPPEEVLMVGDNLLLDAVAPARAGMHGVWLDRYRAEPGPSSPAVTRITTLRDLPDVLAALNRPRGNIGTKTSGREAVLAR